MDSTEHKENEYEAPSGYVTSEDETKVIKREEVNEIKLEDIIKLEEEEVKEIKKPQKKIKIVNHSVLFLLK